MFISQWLGNRQRTIPPRIVGKHFSQPSPRGCCTKHCFSCGVSVCEAFTCGLLCCTCSDHAGSRVSDRNMWKKNPLKSVWFSNWGSKGRVRYICLHLREDISSHILTSIDGVVLRGCRSCLCEAWRTNKSQLSCQQLWAGLVNFFWALSEEIHLVSKQM